MNPLFLNALRGTNQGRPPVWFMRQAGRYMPEYRALRAKYSFMEMCHEPEIAARVTRLPIQAFGFDAAILFSDILVIAEALGMQVRFEEKIGPIFDHPLSTEADSDALTIRDVPSTLGYVAEAIKFVKPQLAVPLIGFCGAPFTVASYMIEGKSSHDLKKTKQWMYRNPESMHRLLDKIATASIDYLKMQIAAGVDAIQIFDSWANALAPQQFQAFSFTYFQKILKELAPLRVPIILFCRGTAAFIPQLVELAPAGISMDWTCDLSQMRRQVPRSIALQGNMDPFLLYSSTAVIRKEVQQILDVMKGDPAYIFNLGHGVFPDVPVDAVKTVVETIRDFVP